MTDRHEHFTLKSNARIEYYTFFLVSNKSNYKEKKGKKREKPKRLLPFVPPPICPSLSRSLQLM